MTTWLEAVTARLGEPSIAVADEVNLGDLRRRCWVWFVDGENHNIAVDRKGPLLHVQAGAPHRRCGLWTTSEPTDEEMRVACRYVGLLEADRG